MGFLPHTFQVAYSRDGINWFWYPSNDQTISYPSLARAEAAALFCRSSLAYYSRIYSIFNFSAPCIPDETYVVCQKRGDRPILGKNI